MMIPPNTEMLLSRYDAFFLDIWGTLHEGGAIFPEALTFLHRLKAENKTVLLVSNAPRRSSLVGADLREKGIPPALYDHLVTSGEDVFDFLSTSHKRYTSLGHALFHLGRPDQKLWEGTPFYPVDTLKEAAFILLAGVAHGKNFLNAYTDLLCQARALDLPMVCANPDQFVMLNGEKIWCAGKLASIYAEGGGPVFWHGKPIGIFFKKIMKLAGDGDPRRMLMIGDGLNTDIRGACYAGIDSLFLAGGMFGPSLGISRASRPEDLEKLDDWLAPYPFRPTYALPSLALGPENLF